ncbi:MAG: polysaccharide pyruvyl transferase family protein, partial [bacterium]
MLEKDFGKDIKEICLVGYYGFGNTGDDAILLAAVEEYTKAYDLYVRILANKHPYIYNMLKNHDNVVIYDRWSIRDINECIYHSDAVIFGGGGIFQDKTSLKSFLYYFSIALLAKINSKKIIIERNSIGPLEKKLSKFLFSKVVQWASYISVRDSLSFDFLIRNYPDFSYKYHKKEDFVLSPIVSDLFQRYYSNKKENDVLFILRPSKYVQNLINLVTLLKDKFRIKIIVFQEEDMETLSNFTQSRDIKIEYPGYGEVHKTIELVKSSNLVISNRLHGVIFSHLVNTKVIAISIDPK